MKVKPVRRVILRDFGFSSDEDTADALAAVCHDTMPPAAPDNDVHDQEEMNEEPSSGERNEGDGEQGEDDAEPSSGRADA